MSEIDVIEMPGGASLPPVKIKTDDSGEPYPRRLVVNRADTGDGNVVISFDAGVTLFVTRDAIGIPPKEALRLAAAIVAAVRVIEYGE